MAISTRSFEPESVETPPVEVDFDRNGKAPQGPDDWKRFRSLQRLLSNRAAMASMIVLVLLLLVAIFASLLAPKSPNSQDLLRTSQGLSSKNWLGTDGFGRDIFSRMLYAIRITLTAAAQGVGVAIILGVPAGLLAGYKRGLLDRLLTQVSDTFMSMPALVLAMAIIGVRGPGLTNAMIAVGVILAPRFFRVARAAALSVREENYIEAAREVGCPPSRILWRHVLPNASGPLLVQVSFGVGLAIAAEASLSFLGLGVQDPEASLGSMVRDAYSDINQSTWAIYPPSILMAVIILSFSVLGDGIRDAMGRETGARR